MGGIAERKLRENLDDHRYQCLSNSYRFELSLTIYMIVDCKVHEINLGDEEMEVVEEEEDV